MIFINPDIPPWVLANPVQAFISLSMLVVIVAAMGFVLKVATKEDKPK